MLELIIYVSGGLIFFFGGLKVSERGLKRGAGNDLKKTIQVFTGNKYSGILTGLVVTSIIQSSSAVSVIVMGFINSGAMTLSQGMGVIMGSNIGTTMTLHILSLKINNFQWILIFIGFILVLISGVSKKRKTYYGGVVCLGFGLIFLGLSMLQLGIEPFKYHPKVMNWLIKLGSYPLLAIIAGIVFTAIIQSSSATSGLVLAIVNQGMLPLKGAIGVILGSNIGTCVTAFLAGIKVSKVARRIAYFHLIFNFYGVLLFSPMIGVFTYFITQLAADPGRQLALAHTLFNIITTLTILPFINLLKNLLETADI